MSSSSSSSIRAATPPPDGLGSQSRSAGAIRPTVRGKFIFIGEEKFWVKGVSYGAFRPNEAKEEYWDQALIERDFAQMAASGINTVRIPHTMPPVTLLDAAARHGLKVMVGLSAEQYVGYLIDTDKKRPDVEAIVREKVRAVAGHPALLCYGIGNEIAASVARWLGAPKIERYLFRIFRAIKSVDPEGIVTYVNYPSTEYFRLPFLDVVSFNVYLESQEKLKAYLARLQSLAGERPLLMSEVGLDALRNGEQKQADVMRWQIATTFAAGCAGVVIFSWTDEWHRAGAEVEDWAFGLTDRARRPKPALAAVTETLAELPFPQAFDWPFISVVVCTYNGAKTLDECLRRVTALSYPNFEVIVINDGSTDDTPTIAARYPCRLVSTPNGGLSAARNRGAAEARGEIIAYLDDDAAPDPHWLHHLGHAFRTTAHAAIGGPNVIPPEHGAVEACVDWAPGGAQHVLLTDEIAEHIPGCNTAVRKACFNAVGGFDPVFRAAGDDVDFCWRIQDRGWTIGFAPGAVVWHHRRGSVRGYLKQQAGYGRAESMLERKWPARYNGLGHHTLKGRLYGGHTVHPLFRRFSVYHGSGGFAPFQSLYERGSSVWGSLPLMPEWYLLMAFLLVVSLLGLAWEPLLVALPVLGIAVALTLIHAGKEALDVFFVGPRQRPGAMLQAVVLVAALHVLQPVARLWGRMTGGLTAWRPLSRSRFVLPRAQATALWTADWREPEKRLEDIAEALTRSGNIVGRGGDYDRWDLEVYGGAFGSARVLMAIEDHGAGTQYVRLRRWPRVRPPSIALLVVLAVLLGLSAATAPWFVGLFFGAGFTLVALLVLKQCGRAMGALSSATATPPVAGASAAEATPGLNESVTAK